MLSHADVWRGVDKLAEVNGLSPSGLAKRAGLDPTTFNKSKRTTRDGRPRWPSTESLAKILEATATPLNDFVGLVSTQAMPNSGGHLLPSVRLSTAHPDQFDPAGFPKPGLDPLETPFRTQGPVYAIDIDSRDYEPVFREGDIVIVAPQVGARRSDRVVVMTKDQGLRLGVLNGRNENRIWIGELADPGRSVEFDAKQICWLSRCLWATL